MKELREYQVTELLPDDNDIVWAFGHKTYCCSLDSEKEPDWYRVKFYFMVCSYRIKEHIPSDPEESILSSYTISEKWDILNEDDEHEFPDGRVIGVTKWRK